MKLTQWDSFRQNDRMNFSIRTNIFIIREIGDIRGIRQIMWQTMLLVLIFTKKAFFIPYLGLFN